MIDPASLMNKACRVTVFQTIGSARLVRAAAALSSLLLASTASGHGMYVAQRHGEESVVIGYSSNDEAYPPEKIAGSTAYRSDGTALAAKLIRHDDHISIEAPPDSAELVTIADYGFYARQSGGRWKQGKKSETSGAGEGLHALKYNVRVLKSGPAGRLHELGLEIVPLEDPLSKKRGDTLPVRVVLDGKPLQGVKLTEDFAGDDSLLAAATDGDGRTQVHLRASRLNVIALEYDAKVANDPDIDFYRYFATLSFDLDHVEPD